MLKEVRLEFGLTQRALARKIGRPESTIWKIEEGHQRIDLVEAWDLAKALRISLPELAERLDQALKDAPQGS